MKARQKRIVRETLESLLSKNERRIQKIAENSYLIRQQIELLDKEKPVMAVDPAVENGETSVIAKVEDGKIIEEKINAVSETGTN